MTRIRLALAIGAAIAAASLGGGCGGDDGKPSATSTSGTEQSNARSGGRYAGETSAETEAASVSLSAPRTGDVVGPTFTARVTLQNFEIDPGAVGKQNVPGKGHLHFVLDRGRYDEPRYAGASGKLAERIGAAGRYSPALKPAITYAGVPRGPHTLEVHLANNDHTDAGPQARAKFIVR